MSVRVRCNECGGRGEVKRSWEASPRVCPKCGGDGSYKDPEISEPPNPAERAIVRAWDAVEKSGVALPLEALERRTPGGIAVVMWVLLPMIGFLGGVVVWLLAR